MWKLKACSGPVAVTSSPSSPQSTWACAPGRTSNRRRGAGRGWVGLVQAGPGLADVDLHPLVVATQPMLGDQPLMDHARLQPRLGPQPGVDQAGVGVELAWARPAPGRCRQRGQSLRGQVALDGPPVMTGLPGDLRPGGPGLGERLARVQFHPLLLRADHALHPPTRQIGPYQSEDGPHDEPTEQLALADLHVKPYAQRHIKVYADSWTLAPAAT